MEALKRPIWRVPLVLAGTGAACRLLTFVAGVVWAKIQLARGSHTLTGGYVTELMAVGSFLLFWAAGWKFLRGLTRRQLFLSATIMVVWDAALLAWEQLSQAMGTYSLLIYRLQATTDSMMWATQLLIRLFDRVTVPVVLPGVLTPYLYLLLGRRSGPD